MTADGAERGHFDFSGTATANTGMCGVTGVAPDCLTPGRLFLLPKCQVGVMERCWKDGKSKARRCRLNYSQKICSRNKYSTWVLFFHCYFLLLVHCNFPFVHKHLRVYPLWKLNIQGLLGAPFSPNAESVAQIVTTSRMKWTLLCHRNLTGKLLPEPKSPYNKS